MILKNPAACSAMLVEIAVEERVESALESALCFVESALCFLCLHVARLLGQSFDQRTHSLAATARTSWEATRPSVARCT